MFLLYFWLVCAVSSVGGTMYWFRHARHGPNREADRLGLFLLYVLLAFTTLLIAALYWWVHLMFKGFNPG